MIFDYRIPLFSRISSSPTTSTGNTRKLAKSASKTSITIPKFWFIENGYVIRAEKPASVVSPDAVIATPILDVAIRIAPIENPIRSGEDCRYYDHIHLLEFVSEFHLYEIDLIVAVKHPVRFEFENDASVDRFRWASLLRVPQVLFHFCSLSIHPLVAAL